MTGDRVTETIFTMPLDCGAESDNSLTNSTISAKTHLAHERIPQKLALACKIRLNLRFVLVDKRKRQHLHTVRTDVSTSYFILPQHHDSEIKIDPTCVLAFSPCFHSPNVAGVESTGAPPDSPRLFSNCGARKDCAWHASSRHCDALEISTSGSYLMSIHEAGHAIFASMRNQAHLSLHDAAVVPIHAHDIPSRIPEERTLSKTRWSFQTSREKRERERTEIERHKLTWAASRRTSTTSALALCRKAVH